MMHHLFTILRQIRRSSNQAGLFVLCVALSLTTLTAISGFGRSVNRALQKDARSLHAADIIIKAYAPLSISLDRAIGRLVSQDRVLRANVHQFYSVVRGVEKKTSVLSRLKVIEPGYPFYGRVVLKSGRPFSQVLAPGFCIVEQPLLDRIGLMMGDLLKVGHATLKIADVVTAEPDRPLDLLSFGPRVFIHNADLEALGLMATGSRIQHIVLLKVLNPLQVETLAAQLRQESLSDSERVDTYLTARSVVQRFLDSFLFFLKLVGLFILIVSGFGIQSTLMALFYEKQHTVAIMKTVGATGRFITGYFLRLVLALGALGTGSGVLAGIAVQGLLAWLLAPLLPEELEMSISWPGVAEGVVLGFTVTVLFSFLPLYRLRQMRPVEIFHRRPATGIKTWPYYLSVLLIVLFFLLLVLWHMRDVRFGFYFVGAVITMILAAALLSQLAVWIIKRLPARHLALRQARRGLFRRGNATRITLITLTVSLTVIFSDHLIERNLNASFVRSFPADLPNVFFVDIQPDQVDAFSSAVGRPVQLYPVIRARIVSVNDRVIDHRQESRKRRDNLSRVFNLTYRETLLDDESLTEGDTLFRSDWNEPQVSVMDTVVDMHAMKVGDRIQFKIQGVPLTARISSIRSRERRSMTPFFYFVFQDAVLEKAPQTLFAAMRMAHGQIGPLQDRLVSQFPNVSVIDMSTTIGLIVRLMTRMSRIILVFSLFSIAAGILILVSATFATRAERMVESVYYKLLGAGRGFVLTVFTLENLLMGLLSSLLAMIMAQAGAWWVCAVRFDLGYRPFFPLSLIMVGLAVFLVVMVGLSASWSIMAKKPVTYLREQQSE